MRLACRLTVGDGDHKCRLPQLAGPSLAHDLVEDLLPELRAHRGEALELNAGHELLDLLLVADVVEELRRRLGIHKADGDAVVVEKGGGEGHTLQDDFEVFDTFAILFKLHGAAIINVKPDVKETELNDITANLHGDPPSLAKLTDLASSAVCDLIYYRAPWRVEATKLVLVYASLKRLLEAANLGRRGLRRRRAVALGWVAAWLLAGITTWLTLATSATGGVSLILLLAGIASTLLLAAAVSGRSSTGRWSCCSEL